MLSVKKILEAKMSCALSSLSPQHTVIDALELMAEKNIGVVVIMDGDTLAGIFSERDYARKGIIQGRKAKSTPLTDVMTAHVFTVSPEMSINDCMNLFSEKHIRHLPVVEAEKVVGLVSIGDVVKAMLREQKSHIQFLEQYISGH